MNLVQIILSSANPALGARLGTVFPATHNQGAGFGDERAARRASDHNGRPGTRAPRLPTGSRVSGRFAEETSDKPNNKIGD